MLSYPLSMLVIIDKASSSYAHSYPLSMLMVIDSVP